MTHMRMCRIASLKSTFLPKFMISMRILGHCSFGITSPAAPGWLPGALALQPPGGGSNSQGLKAEPHEKVPTSNDNCKKRRLSF